MVFPDAKHGIDGSVGWYVADGFMGKLWKLIVDE